jgi:phosphoribosylcarboxyaminoimidazole (NCAIR) mutase
MPSAVAPIVVLEPDNAALAAAKILGLTDKRIQEKVKEYQNMAREMLEKDDQEAGPA